LLRDAHEINVSINYNYFTLSFMNCFSFKYDILHLQDNVGIDVRKLARSAHFQGAAHHAIDY